MSSKIDLPEGLKAQEIEGAGRLQPLLKKLKKYSFKGYLKIQIMETYEGYLVIKDGLPRNALIFDLENDDLEKGLPALQEIHTLDLNPDIHISVHTDIDIEKVIQKVGGELPSRIGEDSSIKEKPQKHSENFLDMIKKSREPLKDLPKGVKETFPENYSFANFIVGPNNRFAYVAALSVAEHPGDSYNPLFITSKTGLGKTHLLKAIGRAHLTMDNDRKVKYVATSKLVAEIEKGRSEDDLSDLKERYIGQETLLLDDLQALSDDQNIQEVIFYILSELQNKGNQIVISADRSPVKIPKMDEKLISRIKSGLVVDVLTPKYQTRKKIIENKVKSEPIDIPDEVVDFMAKRIKKNITSLEGALNRVIAYSSLMNKSVTIDNVEDVLQQYMEKELGSNESLKRQFKAGRSYIIEEETKLSEGLRMVDESFPIEKKYVISRMNPDQIRSDYDLKNSDLIWLTDKSSESKETIPPNLESLSWTLEEKIKESATDVVFIDGIEYLISNNGFDSTLQFIRRIVDIVSETDTVLLVVVNPKALENRQINMLEREMDVIC